MHNILRTILKVEGNNPHGQIEEKKKAEPISFPLAI